MFKRDTIVDVWVKREPWYIQLKFYFLVYALFIPAMIAFSLIETAFYLMSKLKHVNNPKSYGGAFWHPRV